MADESGAPALPEAFANAEPVAPSPAPRRAPRPDGEAKPSVDAAGGDDVDGKKKAAAAKTPGLQSKGVPHKRLLWATLPAGGGVAGVGMYSGNPMIALVAVGLAAVVGGGALAAHVVRRNSSGAGGGRGLAGRGPGNGVAGARGAGGAGGRGGLLSRLRGLAGSGRGAGGGRGLGARGAAGPGLGGRGGLGAAGRSAGGGRAAGGRGALGGAGGRSLGGRTPSGATSGGTGGRGAARHAGGRMNPLNWFGGGRGGSSGAGGRGSTGGGTGRSGGGRSGAGSGGGRGLVGASGGGRGASGAAAGGKRSWWNPLSWGGKSGGRGGSAGGRGGATGSSGGGAGARGASSAAGSAAGSGRRWFKPWTWGGLRGTTGGAKGTSTSGSGGGKSTSSNPATGAAPSGWWTRARSRLPWRRDREPAAPRPESKGQRHRRRTEPATATPSRWQRLRGRLRSGAASKPRSPGKSAATETAEIAAKLPFHAKLAGRWQRLRGRLSGKGAAIEAGAGIEPEKMPRPERTRPLGRKARRARHTKTDAATKAADQLAAKRAEKSTAEEPVDDGGFPTYRRPLPTTAGISPTATARGDLREYATAGTEDLAARVRAAGQVHTKGTDMSIAEQYTNMVDASTPGTQRSTLHDAGAAASRDAAKYAEKATEFRRDAAAMVGKQNMAAAREKCNREAAAAEQTAAQRRGWSAALHGRADAIAG